MVALSPLVFTLRNILDQIGLTSPTRRNRVTRGTRLNHWQSMFAALEYWWWADANVAWRNEILLRDRPERFLTFCRDCGEETPHEGFDEFGAGWYAQICHCRHCGQRGINVWPLA
jgi:hypothetical protein